MGEVIYLHKRRPEFHKMMDDDNSTLSDEDIRRLENIRDNIEELLHMVAGLRRDPKAVALASAWGETCIGSPACIPQRHRRRWSRTSHTGGASSLAAKIPVGFPVPAWLPAATTWARPL